MVNVDDDQEGITVVLPCTMALSPSHKVPNGPLPPTRCPGQEPAAEPDPQPASDDQPEDVGPTTPSALTPQADPEGPTLSKRQKQRLRQRATATPAGFKPAAKRVNAKAEEPGNWSPGGNFEMLGHWKLIFGCSEEIASNDSFFHSRMQEATRDVEAEKAHVSLKRIDKN